MPIVTTKAERTSINNIDIYSMLRRLDRMRVELSKSQSADLPSGLLEPDSLRLTQYITTYREFFKYVESRPLPDAPETHGNFTIALPDDSAIVQPEAVENEDIRSLLFLTMQLRTELQNCQSARLVQGIMPMGSGKTGDAARIADFITRIENFAAYAAKNEPSDRPESTPLAMPTTAGQIGT